jgi:AbiV family abortive infection protein
MDSHYKEYPGLDRTRLRDGYKRCIENAVRLMNDATLLREAGRLRSACFILHQSVIELGNAKRLYEAGRSEVQNWGEWWDSYFAHRTAAGEGEASDLIRPDLVHVGFDKEGETFRAPGEDEDTELLELFDKEAAYADSMFQALPPYGFELLELRETVQQSPELALPALYVWIEEVTARESDINESDLLIAAAKDMGMSPEDAASGFGKWKEVAPKLRVHLDLLQRIQGRLKQKEEGKGATPKVGAYMSLLRRVQVKRKQE